MTDRLDEAKRLRSMATPGPLGVCPTLQGTRRDGTELPCRDQYSLRTMVPVGIDCSDGSTLTSIPFDLCGGLTEQDARSFAALHNLAPDLFALVEAAEKRVAHSHSSSCSAHRFDDLPCTCGHDALRAAVARARGQKP